MYNSEDEFEPETGTGENRRPYRSTPSPGARARTPKFRWKYCKAGSDFSNGTLPTSDSKNLSDMKPKVDALLSKSAIGIKNANNAKSSMKNVNGAIKKENIRIDVDEVKSTNGAIHPLKTVNEANIATGANTAMRTVNRALKESCLYDDARVERLASKTSSNVESEPSKDWLKCRKEMQSAAAEGKRTPGTNRIKSKQAAGTTGTGCRRSTQFHGSGDNENIKSRLKRLAEKDGHQGRSRKR